jgi:predicted GIY-YIG superfamily endonuclease
VGISNNFNRRIRQHNQQIKGGARYTKRSTDWQPFVHVCGFASKRQCLQFEWSMKHRRVKIGGISGRIQTLEKLLAMERWTKKCERTCEMQLSVHIMGLSEETYRKHAKLSKDEYDRRRTAQSAYVTFVFIAKSLTE